MRIVPTWQDNEIVDKEIRSCDNKDLGRSRTGDTSYLVTSKGSRLYQIPRDAIAAFDGDKIYLRATEAETMAGVYPFIGGENCNCECHTMRDTPETPPVAATH